MANHDPKNPTEKNPQPTAKSPDVDGKANAPVYEKPRLRVYAPLQEMTFLTIIGSSGVGVITSISGGGH